MTHRNASTLTCNRLLELPNHRLEHYLNAIKLDISRCTACSTPYENEHRKKQNHGNAPLRRGCVLESSRTNDGSRHKKSFTNSVDQRMVVKQNQIACKNDSNKEKDRNK
jgi:hypothetical protein